MVADLPKPAGDEPDETIKALCAGVNDLIRAAWKKVGSDEHAVAEQVIDILKSCHRRQAPINLTLFPDMAPALLTLMQMGGAVLALQRDYGIEIVLKRREPEDEPPPEKPIIHVPGA